MRFILMHRTSAHWEAGAIPGPELIASVRAVIGNMAQAGILLEAEGLRASSLGVRLNFSGGARTVTHGPFIAANELPAGFVILRVGAIEEAIEWTSRFAGIIGDVEIDIRPVTEPWDIGMGAKPEGLTTQRFMAMHKADRNSEAGLPPTPQQMAAMRSLIEEMTRAGVLLLAEGLQPSAKGLRFKSFGGRHTVTDGPFTESKELIAGFVILRGDSMQDMLEWAPRYAAALGDVEFDIRPLAEKPSPP